MGDAVPTESTSAANAAPAASLSTLMLSTKKAGIINLKPALHHCVYIKDELADDRKMFFLLNTTSNIYYNLALYSIYTHFKTLKKKL